MWKRNSIVVYAAFSLRPHAKTAVCARTHIFSGDFIRKSGFQPSQTSRGYTDPHLCYSSIQSSDPKGIREDGGISEVVRHNFKTSWVVWAATLSTAAIFSPKSAKSGLIRIWTLSDQVDDLRRSATCAREERKRPNATTSTS